MLLLVEGKWEGREADVVVDIVRSRVGGAKLDVTVEDVVGLLEVGFAIATEDNELMLLLCRKAPGCLVIVEGGLVAPISDSEADYNNEEMSCQGTRLQMWSNHVTYKI